VNKSKAVIFGTISLILLFSIIIFFAGKNATVKITNHESQHYQTANSIDSSPTEQSAETQSPTTTILFVGDIMLDRTIAKHAQKYGVDSLFSKVQGLLSANDAVIGNLEGTMSDYPSVSQSDYSILRFTFDPSYARFLKNNHFTAVSLANNHSLDFGKDGYEETVTNIKSAGIVTFGSPFNDKNISTTIPIQGKKICLVGYHDLYVPDSTPAVKEIQKIRPYCSYIILFAHWGVEYKQTATDRQIMLAHKFIDAGADLVIGAHPHVVEPIEIYKNKAIFYSLGNFIFDQNLSFWTEHGLAVRVEFGETSTRFTLIPTTVSNKEVSVASTTDADKLIPGAKQFTL